MWWWVYVAIGRNTKSYGSWKSLMLWSFFSFHDQHLPSLGGDNIKKMISLKEMFFEPNLKCILLIFCNNK
jgi:hypothetical protein